MKGRQLQRLHKKETFSYDQNSKGFQKLINLYLDYHTSYFIIISFQTFFSMETILQILAKNQLLTSSTISGVNAIYFDRRQGQQITYQQQNAFEISTSLASSEENFNKAKAQLDSLALNISFDRSLGVGEIFPSYENLHQVFEDQKVKLVHKPGEVLLVDIWATWCGPCQHPMKHNQQMLVKNQQKWKDRVRIVAVSVDDEKQTIIERVNSRGWTKIEHLTLLGWDNDHPLVSNFQIQGIPFVALIDKQGKINYTGHPSTINLQERINQLLLIQSKEGAKSSTTATSIQTIHAQLKKTQNLQKIFEKQELTQRFGNAELFSFTSRQEYIVAAGNLTKCNVAIQAFAYEDSPQLIKQFKELLDKVDPNCYKLDENLVKSVVPPQEPNPKCADCKTNLAFPYYWCKWDANPNTFRCRDCVEKKPNEEGKHYSYLQNSIFLPAKVHRIVSKGLGSNKQPENISKVEDPHMFGCNGCSGCPTQIGVARYICLACRSQPNPRGDYIDICKPCFDKYLTGDQQVKKNLNVNGHNQSHPLLRILYNINGYYDF